MLLFMLLFWERDYNKKCNKLSDSLIIAFIKFKALDMGCSIVLYKELK